jgi:hypothetical protein
LLLLPLLLLSLALSKAERLLNHSPLVRKQRTITALFNWKAQTSTSDTASSQHSGQEPSTFQPNCSRQWQQYYVGQMATYRVIFTLEACLWNKIIDSKI